MKKSAMFSPCRNYRYTLWRWWDTLFQHGYVMFVGLNPSTADEVNDDNTVRRCIGYAKAWGYSGLCMMNLFAFRARFPKDMKAVKSPVGPDNDRLLIDLSKDAKIVVAAWGNDGSYMERGERVKTIIPRLHCLRLTKSGHPWHPLYLPKNLEPVLMLD